MEPTFALSQREDKQKAYEEFIPDFKAYLDGEDDWISLLANASSALKEAFCWFWVGFYLVSKDGLLHIGPFQGGPACNRIKKGRGVCGTAWATGETQVVEDVDKFPGHIACSSASRSEIVIPMYKNGEIIGVLDIDSEELGTFDATDKKYLEEIVNYLCHIDC